MSGICGWVRFADPAHSRPNPIAGMAARLTRFDGTETHYLNDGGASVALVAPRETGLLYHGADGIAAILGEPRIVGARPGEQARSEGLAKALIDGIRARGPAALADIHGRFALVAVLEDKRQVVIATDRFAVCPLVYALVDGCLVFGSTADAVRMHPDVSPEIDPQALYDYLYFHVIPSPRTAHRAIQRLSPGSWAQLSGTQLNTGKYWHVEFSREREKLSVADLKQEFRSLLKQSIAQETSRGSVGSFLSGGTDSSTISGLLGAQLGGAARTYSIGFDAQGYDEMEYARIAAKHFGTVHHEYYVTPDDVVQAIPKIAQSYDAPFGNSSAVAVYYCALMAREDGVTKLLAGDGGDELFGGNARYAKQYLFSLYGDLPAFLRKRLVEPALCSSPLTAKLPIARKLRSYVEQAAVPMPARLETYNLLEHFGVANVLRADFLQAVDTGEPLRLLTEVYENARALTMLNRMLAVDLKFTLADNDLPKVGQMCELAGVEVAYPLLNDDLVAFSTRLPAPLKLRRTRLRYFFKEALKDFLPAETIAKRKHGFGLPFGPWMLSHRPLYELARNSLNDLKQRDIVRPDFIDNLLGKYVAEHSGYYSAMVWVLMMLEQWFKHHATPNRV